MRLKIRKSRMVIELAMIGNQQAMAKTWLMITLMMMMMMMVKLEQKPDTEEGRGAMNSKCPHPPNLLSTDCYYHMESIWKLGRDTENMRKRARLYGNSAPTHLTPFLPTTSS